MLTFVILFSNLGLASDANSSLQGPRCAVGIPFWKRNDVELTLKVSSTYNSSKNQYTPSLTEIQNAGLGRLDQIVQTCENSNAERGSGLITANLKKTNDKEYELVSLKAESALQKLGKCIEEKLRLHEKLQKEVQKREGKTD